MFYKEAGILDENLTGELGIKQEICCFICQGDKN